MSELSVGTISGLAANDYVIDVASGSQLTQPGMILQVVSAIKTDTFSSSLASGETATITGLSASITPSSTSSKVLVLVDVSGTSLQGDGTSFILERGGSPVSIGDSASPRTSVTFGGQSPAGSRGQFSAAANVLDTPATTSSVTYTVDVHNQYNSATTVYVNRSVDDPAGANGTRAASRITLMEVAG